MPYTRPGGSLRHTLRNTYIRDTIHIVLHGEHILTTYTTDSSEIHHAIYSSNRITSSQTRHHIHHRYYASTPPRRHSQHLYKSIRETNILTYSGTTSNIITSLDSYTTRTPTHTRNIYLMDTDIPYTDSYHTHLLLQRHIVIDSSTHIPEIRYTLLHNEDPFVTTFTTDPSEILCV